VRARKLLQARQHVAAIKCFYVHFFVFVLVMAGLFVLNLMLGPPWWAQWPFIGWGIGVAAHALAVFWRSPKHASSRLPKLISDWEERKIRKLMDEQ
jgi:hypothetical protein